MGSCCFKQKPKNIQAKNPPRAILKKSSVAPKLIKSTSRKFPAEINNILRHGQTFNSQRGIHIGGTTDGVKKVRWEGESGSEPIESSRKLILPSTRREKPSGGSIQHKRGKHSIGSNRELKYNSFGSKKTKFRGLEHRIVERKPQRIPSYKKKSTRKPEEYGMVVNNKVAKTGRLTLQERIKLMKERPETDEDEEDDSYDREEDERFRIEMGLKQPDPKTPSDVESYVDSKGRSPERRRKVETEDKQVQTEILAICRFVKDLYGVDLPPLLELKAKDEELKERRKLRRDKSKTLLAGKIIQPVKRRIKNPKSGYNYSASDRQIKVYGQSEAKGKLTEAERKIVDIQKRIFMTSLGYERKKSISDSELGLKLRKVRITDHNGNFRLEDESEISLEDDKTEKFSETDVDIIHGASQAELGDGYPESHNNENHSNSKPSMKESDYLSVLASSKSSLGKIETGRDLKKIESIPESSDTSPEPTPPKKAQKKKKLKKIDLKVKDEFERPEKENPKKRRRSKKSKKSKPLKSPSNHSISIDDKIEESFRRCREIRRHSVLVTKPMDDSPQNILKELNQAYDMHNGHNNLDVQEISEQQDVVTQKLNSPKIRRKSNKKRSLFFIEHQPVMFKPAYLNSDLDSNRNIDKANEASSPGKASRGGHSRLKGPSKISKKAKKRLMSLGVSVDSEIESTASDKEARRRRRRKARQDNVLRKKALGNSPEKARQRRELKGDLSSSQMSVRRSLSRPNHESPGFKSPFELNDKDYFDEA